MNDEILDRALELADRASRVLRAAGLQNGPVLIGGVAFGFWGHERFTADVDLLVVTGILHQYGEKLRAQGFVVSYRSPDEGDPLGGLLVVHDPSDPKVRVEFINFSTDRRSLMQKLGLDTAKNAKADLIEGSELLVADLPHLIALKLYAAGQTRAPKDEGDLAAVLGRCSDETLVEIRSTCERLGFGPALAASLAKLGR